MPIATFSGLASGIDSKSLIQALIEARQKPNDIRKKNISNLEAENDSLEELNTKILALNDLVDKFRTANAGGVSKKASSSDTTIATASVSPSANSGTVSVTVNSVASTGTASFDDTYATTSTALAPNTSGTQTVEILVGTGSNQKSVSTSITSSTTVQQFVDAINSDSDASGNLTASLVNVGTTSTPSYRVVFSSLQQGTDLGTIAFNIPSGAAGFGGSTNLQNRTVNQATDASFNVSGITTAITRSTNTVSDVLSGVTFNLAKAGTTTLTITDDSDTTAKKMKEIVDSYNDIVKFINKNNTITDIANSKDLEKTYGSLAKSSIDEDFLSQFRSTFSATSASSGTTVTSFAELGIATNRDGTLTFDETKFKENVGADPTGAQEVLRNFADDTAGVSGFMYQFTSYLGFIDNSQGANSTEIENLNDSISRLDRYTDKLRQNLEGQFSRLESLTAQLQSTQNALSGVLAGLGG
jgi:flagellar hook-associated protein 2